MNKNIKTKYKKNGGAAMMTLVFFFVFISLTILIGIVTPVVREFKIVAGNLESKQAYFLAESGIEDVVYRMKNNLNFNDTENLVLGDSFTITTVTDLGGSKKQINTISDTNFHQRKINTILTTSTGVSFNYGVLVGLGGVDLVGSSGIYGNVYANGPVTGDSSSFITGTAISANSPNVSTSESNGTGNPSYNIVFGKTSSAQDVAQSFKVSESKELTKIQVYIKKNGNPSNLTVKVVTDSDGKPSTNVITSGTLPASSVTSSYGWVDISFSSNPILNTSTTYWLVLDIGNSSNNKYYTIGASSNTYGNGLGKIGVLGGTWNNTNPSGLDYYFGIYLGGFTGLVAGSSGSQWNPLHVGTVSGSAQAHTVNYTDVTGDIYCKTGSGNNKSCLDQPDPVFISMPISESNITEWQTDALSGGIYNGDYTVGPWPNQNVSLGPKKINGNLTVTSGGILTITGTLWVTGDIVLSGGGLIKLSPSYGINDGVIVSDGNVSISGGGYVEGSGSEGSYIMFLSKSTSTQAINLSGDAGAAIVYAENGTINISGGSSLKEATGYKINLSGNSSITYESGLSNNNFSSGPSGSWSINSWEEVE